MIDSRRPGSDRVLRLLRHAVPALSAIPVVLIPALEWIPGLSRTTRTWLILLGLALACIGLVVLSKNQHRVEQLSGENALLSRQIRQVDPGQLLQQIAATLFRDGAWRFGVYVKVPSSELHEGDQLLRLASVASDRDQSDLGPRVVAIQPRTMFANVFTTNLADPRFRNPIESGSFPFESDESDWATWRDGIFGRPRQGLEDRSSLRPRKFAWYAAQDPRTQKVVVTIAESAHPDGIAVEHLNHTFTPAWLFFVAQLAELRGSATPQEER